MDVCIILFSLRNDQVHHLPEKSAKSNWRCVLRHKQFFRALQEIAETECDVERVPGLVRTLQPVSEFRYQVGICENIKCISKYWTAVLSGLYSSVPLSFLMRTKAVGLRNVQAV